METHGSQKQVSQGVLGFIGLEGQESLDRHRYEEVLRFRSQILKVIDSRASYVSQHGLDPEIAYPGGNWGSESPNAMHKLFRLVSSGGYEVINNIRLYTQPFTGFDLASLTFGHRKTPIPFPIPHHLDEQTISVNRSAPMSQNLPSRLVVRFPKTLGEIGWNIGGHPVNYDTLYYQELLGIMYSAGIIDWADQRLLNNGSLAILEIGGGYGGLAYQLKRVFPNASYVICDLPESLLFSSIFLSIVSPDHQIILYRGSQGDSPGGNGESNHGFVLLPNHMFAELLEKSLHFDLVINTLSFSEMSVKQIRNYAQGVSTLIGQDGILFELNNDLRYRGLAYCKLYLAQHLKYRETLLKKSLGEADLWANAPVRQVIGGGLDRGLLARIVGRRRLLAWTMLRAARRTAGIRLLTDIQRRLKSRPRLLQLLWRVGH